LGFTETSVPGLHNWYSARCVASSTNSGKPLQARGGNATAGWLARQEIGCDSDQALQLSAVSSLLTLGCRVVHWCCWTRAVVGTSRPDFSRSMLHTLNASSWTTWDFSTENLMVCLSMSDHY